MHVPSVESVMFEVQRVTHTGGLVIADATILENIIYSHGLLLFLKSWFVKYFYYLLPSILKKKVIWKPVSTRQFLRIFKELGIQVKETVDSKSSKLNVAVKL